MEVIPSGLSPRERAWGNLSQTWESALHKKETVPFGSCRQNLEHEKSECPHELIPVNPCFCHTTCQKPRARCSPPNHALNSGIWVRVYPAGISYLPWASALILPQVVFRGFCSQRPGSKIQRLGIRLQYERTQADREGNRFIWDSRTDAEEEKSECLPVSIPTIPTFTGPQATNPMLDTHPNPCHQHPRVAPGAPNEAH